MADPELPRSFYDHLINEWIFSERDRAIIKRRMFDGITYESLAEEFNMSERNIKYIVNRCRRIIGMHLV